MGQAQQELEDERARRRDVERALAAAGEAAVDGESPAAAVVDSLQQDLEALRARLTQAESRSAPRQC